VLGGSDHAKVLRRSRAEARMAWRSEEVLQPRGPDRVVIDLDVPDASDARLDLLDVLAGKLLRKLNLHAEHELFPLALRLDLLRRELRFRRYEAHEPGSGA